MDQTIIILIASGISAVFSIVLLIWQRRESEKLLEKQVDVVEEWVHEAIKSAGQAVINTINTSLMEQLDPILKLNSQAMSIIGSQGAKVNQIKMMEKQVMEAVNESLPITPDMIEEFSPALAETLRKFPELMPKAVQVFEKITGGGGDWGFNLPGSNSLSKLNIRRPEE